MKFDHPLSANGNFSGCVQLIDEIQFSI